MKAKIISFVSAKGGSGKTVISASFAKFLGNLNKKVLLVDTDADTNGLTIFYVNKVVNARENWNKKERPIGVFEDSPSIPSDFKIEENVNLIPASFKMKQTANVSIDLFKNNLDKIITYYSDKYDYIFLDAQAGSDIFAEINIKISDEIIIVSEYDPVSLAGIDRLKSFFYEISQYEKRWVLYNKVLPELSKNLSDIRITERILAPIPWDKQVVLSFARRELALDLDKGNQYTLAIMRSIASLLGSEIEKQIDDWKNKKSEQLREPINKQLIETKKEMLALENVVAHQQIKLEDLADEPNKFIIRRLTNLLYFAISISLVLVLITQIFPEFSYVDIIFPAFFGFIIAIAGDALRKRDSLLKSIKNARVQRKAELEVMLTQLEEIRERYFKYKTMSDSNVEDFLRTQNKD